MAHGGELDSPAPTALVRSARQKQTDLLHLWDTEEEEAGALGTPSWSRNDTGKNILLPREVLYIPVWHRPDVPPRKLPSS